MHCTTLICTVWKFQDFSVIQILRDLTKIFFIEREFLVFPHCAVQITVEIWQKFRESNIFTKELLIKWFNEIFFLSVQIRLIFYQKIP